MGQAKILLKIGFQTNSLYKTSLEGFKLELRSEGLDLVQRIHLLRRRSQNIPAVLPDDSRLWVRGVLL